MLSPNEFLKRYWKTAELNRSYFWKPLDVNAPDYSKTISEAYNLVLSDPKLRAVFPTLSHSDKNKALNILACAIKDSSSDLDTTITEG